MRMPMDWVNLVFDRVVHDKEDLLLDMKQGRHDTELFPNILDLAEILNVVFDVDHLFQSLWVAPL